MTLVEKLLKWKRVYYLIHWNPFPHSALFDVTIHHQLDLLVSKQRIDIILLTADLADQLIKYLPSALDHKFRGVEF